MSTYMKFRENMTVWTDEPKSEGTKNIITHIESLKENDVEILKFIDSTIGYLMFLKRFLILEPDEKEALSIALSWGNINEDERKKLGAMINKEQKEHYIQEIARTNYNFRCAWLAYLHGEKGYEKPPIFVK